MTGQEERDVLFARLFGLTSVIQSGLLVRQRPPPISASTSSLPSSSSSYKETLSQLLLLGVKKSWLRESAWWTIILALDALNASDVSWKEEAIDITVEGIFVDIKIWTPEKVALALKLQAWYPERDWRKYLSPTFKNPDILSTGNLTMLASILKVS
jgi:DNA polymerase phi